MTGMKYDAGYDKLDPAKRSMQVAAASTGGNIAKRFGHGWSEVAWSRGESAYLVESPFGYLAHVDEGLGTKDLSAQYLQLMTSSVDGYTCVAQDSAAMILNDLVTTGALPVSLSMHLAVGDAG
jgi:phosphoribosylformylglycinamidine cyclo-ligase